MARKERGRSHAEVDLVGDTVEWLEESGAAFNEGDPTR